MLDYLIDDLRCLELSTDLPPGQLFFRFKRTFPLDETCGEQRPQSLVATFGDQIGLDANVKMPIGNLHHATPESHENGGGHQEETVLELDD